MQVRLNQFQLRHNTRLYVVETFFNTTINRTVIMLRDLEESLIRPNNPRGCIDHVNFDSIFKTFHKLQTSGNKQPLSAWYCVLVSWVEAMLDWVFKCYGMDCLGTDLCKHMPKPVIE